MMMFANVALARSSCKQMSIPDPNQPASEHGHAPVLLDEVMELLAPGAGETAIDCTAGRGGHSLELARAVGPEGTVALCDADEGNLAYAGERVATGLGRATPRLLAWHANFVDAPRRATSEGLAADVVLADLGFASSQMDDAERGLSIRLDGPLDMRFDRSLAFSARDAVATWSEEELAQVIRDFGEDPAARRIARAIVQARGEGAIDTTGQLARVVRGASGRGRARGDQPTIDPATRTFQALRIAVNDELGSLASLLESVTRGATSLAAGSPAWLAPGARVGIISFHSLEDRAVKRAFGELVKRGLAESIGARPVVASEGEVSRNPRARSAKLRVVKILARLAGDSPIH
jgi:16S rRNA (cytosine1402-N4)-methyltransferase